MQRGSVKFLANASSRLAAPSADLGAKGGEDYTSTALEDNAENIIEECHENYGSRLTKKRKTKTVSAVEKKNARKMHAVREWI